jgi:hypothetical protein
VATNESAEILRSWRELYRAALFETDTSKLPSRIEQARSALVFRSRQLFVTSPNYDDETDAIENALYALQALENCLRFNTKDRRRAPRDTWTSVLPVVTPLHNR